MRALKYIILFFGLYIFLWTVVYAVLMKFDFRYYMSYLWLSWTNPGEMPAYIQMVSVILTLLLAIGFLLWKFVVNR